MAVPAQHIHISERESDGSWEDCTWDSGLEWYRLAHDPTRPATHAEAEALRKASGEGPDGGSNIGDLTRGILARYKRAVAPSISGWSALWAALTPGTVAVVQGGMRAFGPAHRLSRWDANFDGGHAVCVMRLDSTNRVWWCDPLAPANGYEGEWVTASELEQYVKAFGGQHLVAPIITEADDMPNIATYAPGHTLTVTGPGNIRKAPTLVSTDKLRSLAAGQTEEWTVTGTVRGTSTLGTAVWYTRWNAGEWEYAHSSLCSTPVPPTTIDPSELVKAKNAGVEQGVRDERMRIRSVLGV